MSEAKHPIVVQPFKFKIKLTRTADGLERIVDDEFWYPGWDGEEAIETIKFMWEEGNQSCDCNRHSYFSDDEDAECTDIPCSDDKYTAELIFE